MVWAGALAASLRDAEGEGAWLYLVFLASSIVAASVSTAASFIWMALCGRGWNAEEAYRNTAARHESLPRRIDNRSVSQMVRDHRAHMAHLYDARDRELSSAEDVRCWTITHVTVPAAVMPGQTHG